MVTDNEAQFTDKNLRKLFKDLEIKHYYYTSLKHPQTNGQVEVANIVMLRGLRRRLEGPRKTGQKSFQTSYENPGSSIFKKY